MLDPNSIPPLTSEQEQILADQSITMERPGSMLRDFQSLLDAVGSDGIRVSGTKHFIYAKRLPELNARLVEPIAAEYKRPVQKAYPPIHGLYLLLRGTGIVRVAKKDGQLRLLRNKEVAASWEALNPTERYMNLLEAWLNRADEEAIFDNRSMPFGNLYRCLQLLKQIPEAGLTPDSTGERDELRYWPGYHNLALMKLFGFIELDEKGTAAGEPWHITRVQHRPWGDALLYRLARLQYEKLAGESESTSGWEDETGSLTTDDLQEDLKTFFPEWNRTLRRPGIAFRPEVHVFKVELYDACWWTMAVPGSATLHEVSSTILDTVTFDRDHLYRFTYKDPFGHQQSVNIRERFSDPPYADEVRIGDLPLQEGEQMVYLYDFGDHWEFDLHLQEIAPEGLTAETPTVLDFHGDAPEQYPSWDEERW